MKGSAKRGHSPDMSGLVEGKPVKSRDACDYVKQPGNAYGKGKSGLQPNRARRQSYTPDDKAPKR